MKTNSLAGGGQKSCYSFSFYFHLPQRNKLEIDLKLILSQALVFYFFFEVLHVKYLQTKIRAENFHTLKTEIKGTSGMELKITDIRNILAVFLLTTLFNSHMHLRNKQ